MDRFNDLKLFQSQQTFVVGLQLVLLPVLVLLWLLFDLNMIFFY